MITRTATTLAGAGALALTLLPASGDDDDTVDASAFGYDADAPLDLVEGEAIELPFPGAVHPITYESPGGEVTGYIAYPPEGPSTAGIIVMHGMPERADDTVELPLSLMACFGATAIAIDAPYVRADRMSAPLTFTETDRDETIQLVVDLRRAVDVLESKGIERIAYDGYSWSSDVGVVLAGVEPRIDGFAIMAGSLVVDRFIRDGSPIDALADQPDDVVEPWLEVMSTVSALEFVGDASAPIVFRNNSNDTISTPASAQRLQEVAGPEFEIEWYDDSPDPAGHDMSMQMIFDHLHWQADVIGLDGERVDECLAPLIGPAPQES